MHEVEYLLIRRAWCSSDCFDERLSSLLSKPSSPAAYLEGKSREMNAITQLVYAN
jgi:hypothetical protein